MSVTVQGLEQVDAHLAAVENAEEKLRPAVERAVELLFRRVQSTTPVDTGRLVSHLTRQADGLSGSVFFEPTYGPYGHRYDQYVKGEGQQAWMHRGRVPHVGDDLAAVRPQIEALFEEVMQELTGG